MKNTLNTILSPLIIVIAILGVNIAKADFESELQQLNVDYNASIETPITEDVKLAFIEDVDEFLELEEFLELLQYSDVSINGKYFEKLTDNVSIPREDIQDSHKVLEEKLAHIQKNIYVSENTEGLELYNTTVTAYNDMISNLTDLLVKGDADKIVDLRKSSDLFITSFEELSAKYK